MWLHWWLSESCAIQVLKREYTKNLDFVSNLLVFVWKPLGSRTCFTSAGFYCLNAKEFVPLHSAGFPLTFASVRQAQACVDK